MSEDVDFQKTLYPFFKYLFVGVLISLFIYFLIISIDPTHYSDSDCSPYGMKATEEPDLFTRNFCYKKIGNEVCYYSLHPQGAGKEYCKQFKEGRRE